MKIKKIFSMSFLFVVGVVVIYGLNRFVTRPYTSNAAEEVAESQIKATIEKNKTQESSTKEQQANKQEEQEKQEKQKDVKLPTGEAKDWNLLLVSPTHPLEVDFSEENFATLANGMQVDKRIVSSLEQLQTAAADAGYPLVIVSAYRSISYQEQIFQDYLNNWAAQGYTDEEALEKVKETSTEPGFSEHHTGLAVDLVDEVWSNNYPQEILEAGFAETAGGKWLAEHACQYGFILRYPIGKEAITSINFEPWHFRYVGVEHAKYIEAHGLTLEEYLDILNAK